MLSPNIARVSRGLARGLSAVIIATHASHAQQVAAGQYAFSGIASGNRPFSGIIHVTNANGIVGGRLITTLSAPMPLRSAQMRGDSIAFAADPGGGRTIALSFARSGDSLVGAFNDGTSTGPLQARYVTKQGDDPNELRPVPCRARGMTEMVRCATHWVYEDRARGAGRRIPLNIVILPALSPTPAPDPLFHFAGGPGEAATDQAAANAQRFAAIRRDRDIVMVDQRGAGGSNELTCVFEGSRERATLLFGGVFPDNELARCRADLEKRADLRLYHTDIAVRDVDDVRAWLGYDRINIYGGSYGTKAALYYMRRFPDRVRTSTLRAVQAVESSMLENARDSQDALDRVIAACASEAPCAAAYPNLRSELATVLATADTHPTSLRVFDAIRKDTVDIAITRGVFAGALRRLLMDGETARSVPLAIHQAATGSWTLMRLGLTRTLSISADIAWGMMVSIICTEEPPKIARGDIARAAAGTFYGDAQVKTIVPTCAKWASGTPPSDYDKPVRVNAPTLLLSGDLDPTTPPRMGEMAARALPNSVHLVMPGVSHSPFPQCAIDVMTALVASGSVKGLDTSCISSLRRQPFVVP